MKLTEAKAINVLTNQYADIKIGLIYDTEACSMSFPLVYMFSTAVEVANEPDAEFFNSWLGTRLKNALNKLQKGGTREEKEQQLEIIKEILENKELKKAVRKTLDDQYSDYSSSEDADELLWCEKPKLLAFDRSKDKKPRFAKALEDEKAYKEYSPEQLLLLDNRSDRERLDSIANVFYTLSSKRSDFTPDRRNRYDRLEHYLLKGDHKKKYQSRIKSRLAKMDSWKDTPNAWDYYKDKKYLYLEIRRNSIFKSLLRRVASDTKVPTSTRKFARHLLFRASELKLTGLEYPEGHNIETIAKIMATYTFIGKKMIHQRNFENLPSKLLENDELIEDLRNFYVISSRDKFFSRLEDDNELILEATRNPLLLETLKSLEMKPSEAMERISIYKIISTAEKDIENRAYRAAANRYRK